MNLQNMAPNAKRSLLLTLVFAALAAGLYFGAISTTEAQLEKVGAALRADTARHRAMTADLNGAGQVLNDIATNELRLAGYAQGMIEPLLESTAMRAKALVDALAAGCGLFGMEYESLTPIALPIVGKAPAQQFVRCPVKITCRGSYQAAVSFVQCVEKRFPLVVCESFAVNALADPEFQQISVILEWPMKKEGK